MCQVVTGSAVGPGRSGGKRGRGGKAGKVHFIMYCPGGEIGGAR